MNIILTAVNEDLYNAWNVHCSDVPGVAIYHGDIFDVNADALVSPANSFGFMDGGIDMLYTQRFGWHVQERLQDKIRSRHNGELLVGCAEIVETDNIQHPFIISAPTMRVPQVLTYTANPYLAARAVLLLIKNGEFVDGVYAGLKISDIINTVAFPGLGTGVGRVGPNTCAHQMRMALDEFYIGSHQFPLSWQDAVDKHKRCYMGYLGEVDI